ncbi:hypothetical protein IF1G_01357 [Cordyceps javanica]|uniref:Uncharacterized protein n=1 Tax=Cordyceps javanica TaxID=43265 RepID=A0A545VBM7_9HYPO|nr:hypothetical protein IF1G_01357 [Cordyceps javanica]
MFSSLFPLPVLNCTYLRKFYQETQLYHYLANTSLHRPKAAEMLPILFCLRCR